MKIRAIVIRPGQEFEVASIGTSLEDLQALVGGLVQMVPVGDGVSALMNEEGKLSGLEPCAAIPTDWDTLDDLADVLVGTVALISGSTDEDGEMIGLTDADMVLWAPRVAWAQETMRDMISVRKRVGF